MEIGTAVGCDTRASVWECSGLSYGTSCWRCCLRESWPRCTSPMPIERPCHARSPLSWPYGLRTRVDSSTAGPGRHHGRPGKWENRGLLGSSLDRVLDNDASLMLTTVWKRGKPAKMAVRAQENRACGAKKRRALRATRGLKRRPCGRPHTHTRGGVLAAVCRSTL